MAALVVEDFAKFDLADLRSFLAHRLPVYARPVFLRFRPRLDLTGTFKPKKTELVAEGFEGAPDDEPVYFDDLLLGVYARVDAGLVARIKTGAVKV
jgi:fatty-acyl-CoA synthase